MVAVITFSEQIFSSTFFKGQMWLRLLNCLVAVITFVRRQFPVCSQPFDGHSEYVPFQMAGNIHEGTVPAEVMKRSFSSLAY